MKTFTRLIVVVFLIITTSHCFLGCSGDTSPVPTYTVSGTITGLVTNGLVLQNNGSDDLAVAGDSFEFPAALIDGAEYEVTILDQPTGQKCDVANGSGTINGSNISDVTIVCYAWGMAEQIETNNDGDASFPQVAIDNTGNVIAVWEKNDGTRTSIWANYYTSGSGWGTAHLIETNDEPAQNPHIAVDDAGNATVVWEQGVGIYYSIWANRYTVSSGWGTAQLIETGDGQAWNPQLAVDTVGNATVVWYQTGNNGYDIWSNRYTFGLGWSTAQLIETNDDRSAVAPDIGVDAAGNVTAIWRYTDLWTSNNLFINRYIIGSGWGIPEEFETIYHLIAGQKIAINATGNAIATWSVISESVRIGDELWAKYYSPSSGWGTEEQISEDLFYIVEPYGYAIYTSASSPDLSIDSNGNAFAIWSQSDGMNVNIYARRYSVDSGWGTAHLVETNDYGAANFARIAVDAAGNTTAVWQQDDDIRSNIWANRYSADSGWGVAQLIETDNDGAAQQPEIAINAAGNAMAVWAQSDGERFHIYANRLE